MLRKIIVILVILIFPAKILFAADVPVIVIAPGKTPQSLSTVGSTVTVIDGDQIINSSNLSLAQIIDENSTSTNMFQTGGHGGNIGIQIRGIEKRYSTVYIDGVKMLDPSSSDGSFYMENIMKHSIDRVEILKGTQSSLYGSNAIGGTIHIFTKKGREGNHSNFEIETGSNNTKNFVYSLDGAGDKIQYYLGLNKFLTDGISAMNDNNEDDQYRNDGINGNFGYKINENFKIENSFRYADTFYEYDEVVKGRVDNETKTDNLEGSLTLKLLHEKNKFKNSLTYNKLHIERATSKYDKTNTTYFGYRDAINYMGEYNFNLENKIVYGIETELDASRYPKDDGTKSHKHDEGVTSQYFDFQFRPFQKIYSTFGLRSDKHTTAGRKTSGRATIAYLLDGNSKIRSSFGAGVRFPSLYDYSYGSNPVSAGGTLEHLKSERGLSFDIGYDTYLNDLDMGLSMTLFRTEQKNSLDSNARTNWVQANNAGVNTSQGLELSANWKPTNKKIKLNFGYTFTDSYDANSCNPDEMAAYSDGECQKRGSGVQSAKVRVPRHAIQSGLNYNINPKFKTSLIGKYASETRDVGNQNDGWIDQILTDYLVFDLQSSYKLFNSYEAVIRVGNITDEEYQQAHEYSTMGRTFNFLIKRVY